MRWCPYNVLWMQKHACFSDVFEGFHTLQGHYPAVDPDDGEPRLLYPAVRKSANNADIRITITAVASASRSANKRRILSPLNEVIAFGMVLP